MDMVFSGWGHPCKLVFKACMDAWMTSITNDSKPYPRNVLNVQYATKIFQALSLHLSSVNFAQGGREPGYGTILGNKH